MKPKHKWLVVVNLGGVHPPKKLTGSDGGWWWDKSGDYGWSAKEENDREGYKAAVFNSAKEARIYWRGANAVARSIVETWK